MFTFKRISSLVWPILEGKNFRPIKFEVSINLGNERIVPSGTLNRVAKVDEGGQGCSSSKVATKGLKLSNSFGLTRPRSRIGQWPPIREINLRFARRDKCAFYGVSRATDNSSSIRVLVQPWIWRGEMERRVAWKKKREAGEGGAT